MAPPRVISGKHKNRRLKVPENVRPTAERAREALFDILESRGLVQGAAVLDLFAGTGAIGIEALSRGAAQATFVEQDRATARALIDNLEHVGESDRGRVVVGDASRLGRPTTSFDWVYVDPPYRSDLQDAALRSLLKGAWLKPEALVVLELAPKTPFEPPTGLEVEDERRYGPALLRFMRQTAG